jgi:hypothetical protein
VPIFSGKDAIGVISVESTQTEGEFNEDDLHLLTTLAANVGVAIEKPASTKKRNAGHVRWLSSLKLGAKYPLHLIYPQSCKGSPQELEISSMPKQRGLSTH